MKVVTKQNCAIFLLLVAVSIGFVSCSNVTSSSDTEQGSALQCSSSIQSGSASAEESFSSPFAEDKQQLYNSPSVFLNEEQNTLFETAQKMEYALWGLSGNLQALHSRKDIMNAPSFIESSQNHPIYVEFNGHNYELYQNTYQEFSDFFHTIFTDEFLSQPSIAQKFINYNGQLAVSDEFDLKQIPYYTGYIYDFYPEDFHELQYYPVTITDTQVDFIMVAYYNSNETYEIHETYSYDDMEKVEYPVQMVKTENGWRVNEYHSPELG